MTSADTEPALVRDAVRAVRNGNADAFGSIVRLYQRRVFGLTLMFLRNPAAAEDVAQEAFVRAFTHLDAYDESRPFYPWLATIAVRLSQNRLVQHDRAVRLETPPSASDLVDPAAADPLEALISDEDGRRPWRLVSSLPAGERTAVILHYQHELGVREVARAMGVTAGTVKTFLFRARQHLRRLADSSPEEGTA